jgi:hypothetical protein
MLLKILIGTGFAVMVAGIIMLMVYGSYSPSVQQTSTTLKITSYILIAVGAVTFMISFWIDTRDDNTVKPIK